MSKGQNPHNQADTGPMPHDLRALAYQAIRVMAARARGPANLSEQRIEALCETFLSDHDEARHLALLKLRQEAVSLTDIIDTVIPAVARLMGQKWADDVISFADVTIGSSRLQEAVRLLGRKERSWRAVQDAGLLHQPAQHPPLFSGAVHKRILLVIPRPEHHTLGIFVVSEQFRRLGFHVEVAIDKHHRQIVDMVKYRAFDMIGVTAAGHRTLASARDLVHMIRVSLTRATPIVLGGSLTEPTEELKRITGVDFVVRDAISALTLCGFETEATRTLLPVGGGGDMTTDRPTTGD